MYVYGNYATYKLSPAGTGSAEVDLSNIRSGKLVKIIPQATGIHLLITPVSDTTDADANDYLLPTVGSEFPLGGGLDRISVYNSTGGTLNVYVAVLSQ